MIKRLLTMTVLLPLIGFQFGCAASNSFNVIASSEGVVNDKTIMVPPGSGGMLGVTKQILSDKNWKMVALQGSKKITGNFEDRNVDITEYRQATANYILDVKEQFLGYECKPVMSDFAGVPQTSNFRYSVSIIDWQTGIEVLTIGGSGCLYDIKTNLIQHIP